jgi:hypothetical protein
MGNPILSENYNLPMRIDPEDIRRRYAIMSDEELLSLNAEELSDIARPIYEREVAGRGLDGDPAPVEEEASAVQEEAEPAPDWAEDAAVICTIAVDPSTNEATGTGPAVEALEAAGIPCHLHLMEDQPATRERPARRSFLLMVPGPLALPASSILDRDVLNAEHENEWRGHLAALSDDELKALDPDLICAGLLDRVHRLRTAYAEELASRG